MPHPHERVSEWLGWTHSPTLRLGLFIGVALSLTMFLFLLFANRLPNSLLWLERFALFRTLGCAALFAMLMLVPIARFRRSPRRMFASAMLGWTVFTLAYIAAGNFFENLSSRLRTPGVVFSLGAVVYGLAAILGWVLSMLLAARHHPLHSRRRARPDTHQ